MLKRAALAAVVGTCLSAVAVAQTETPPPVETMDCAAMLAELTVAGQRMNSQLDPEFGREAQAMQQEVESAQRRGMAAGVGASAACSLPGAGAACMAAQQAQAAQAQRDAARHQERMNAQTDRLNRSMDGIDQQRMMALTERYEAMNCQTPQ
ncbi:MAG TPA: hypothetical protein VEA80_16490 [Vitreimonas sp.]|uniref:hypothetical protein n=1 Tax=Vitreimonas sp. TaxID=3069702 RepID=UPI002D230D02|nr:hypothetical protein [Vitreimonas sp.]HYD89077.1 hypothetical protein [Vitreimonas sp.]